MASQKRFQLELENLEERLVPSFNFNFDPTSSTWTVTQAVDNGAATVNVNATNNLVVTDGSGSATVGVAGANLTINMLGGSGDNLAVTLDTALTGNLTVNQGAGSESTTFNGAANSVGGNVSMTTLGGTDTITVGTAMSVGGFLSISAGPGSDTFSQAATLNVGGNATLRGIRNWSDGGNVDTIGGNLTFNVSKNIAATLTLTAGDTIGGNFTFLGGNLVTAGADSISFGGAGAIGGSAYVNLGNVVGAGSATVTLSGTATIGKSLTLLGGTGNGAESFTSATTNVFGGSVYMNLGNGSDTATVQGVMGGNAVTVLTGFGADSVTYGGTGNRVSFFANLGAGADTFTLNSKASGTSLGSLYVDFGPGVDSFVNLYGAPFDFPVRLLNLP